MVIQYIRQVIAELIGIDAKSIEKLNTIYGNNTYILKNDNGSARGILYNLNGSANDIGNLLLISDISLTGSKVLDLEGGKGIYILHKPKGKQWESLVNATAAVRSLSFIKDLTDKDTGRIIHDTTTNKLAIWDGGKWIDANGNNLDFKSQGTFSQKPSNPSTGFSYFCTDKQTTEGSRNGIMIYYAGDGTWVDALGRVIS